MKSELAKAIEAQILFLECEAEAFEELMGELRKSEVFGLMGKSPTRVSIAERTILILKRKLAYLV